MNIEQLKKQFELPGAARIEAGRGGLTKVVVTMPAQASGEVYLHGAHVTHWQPAGQKAVLWMSQSSWFDPGKPIRGGVPVCFPWFGPREGDPKAPAHGFARISEWELESVRQGRDGAVTVALALGANEATRKFWPVDFVLRHVVTFGPSALEMKLEMQNRSPGPIRFEEALHTYLAVGDIRRATVSGLQGTRYMSKVEGGRVRQQADPLIRFTGETDRVYLDTRTPCIVDDPVLQRRIEIAKEGSRATVVWNPWIAKAKAMPDFADDEWPGMLCVETVNVGDSAVELAGNASHTMAARIRLV